MLIPSIIWENFYCSKTLEKYMVSLSDTAKEVAYELGKVDKSVTHEYIIEHTSIENVSESKEALRELIDFGLITTTPGFTYRLAHNEQADDFRTKS